LSFLWQGGAPGWNWNRHESIQAPVLKSNRRHFLRQGPKWLNRMWTFRASLILSRRTPGNPSKNDTHCFRTSDPSTLHEFGTARTLTGWRFLCRYGMRSRTKPISWNVFTGSLTTIEEVLGETTVTIGSRLPLTDRVVTAFESSWFTVRALIQRIVTVEDMIFFHQTVGGSGRSIPR
jgi:hypothetical protein